MSVYSLPLQISFFETVARGWLAQSPGAEAADSALKSGIIFVPSPRAARALGEAFIRVLEGRSFLLPRILTVKEAQLALNPKSAAAVFSLKPEISALHRTGVLMSLVQKYQEVSKTQEAQNSARRLWGLAESLGDLMDEADRAEITLSEAIEKAQAAGETLSAHWEKILIFLAIVSRYFPEWLLENNFLNPLEREVQKLRILADFFAQSPSEDPVWAVGFADGSSGIAPFLSGIAGLKRGRVVLRGVDMEIPPEIWEILPQSHPQFIFKDLLERLSLPREAMAVWELPFCGRDGKILSQTGGDKPARECFWREAFSPEMRLEMQGGEPVALKQPAQTWLIEAEDAQQEALAIALALRDGISEAGKTAALVTPDRQLALRVSAALKRFGITADDSAGTPLSMTPSAVFLRLVARAAEGDFAAVPLLALLKHPMAVLGLDSDFELARKNCRELTRTLELEILRGPPVNGGFAGLREKLEALGGPSQTVGKKHALSLMLENLERAFAPFAKMRQASYETYPVLDLLQAVIETAETLSKPAQKTDGEEQPSVLWRGEDGQKLSEHLAEFLSVLETETLPDQPLEGFAEFLEETMRKITLTGLRTYRDGEEIVHPRIAILGILEARLLSFDLLVLGGLNEGIWPPKANCGPWMGRAMRKTGGMFLPERRLGAYALDFYAFACSSDKIIFSRAMREGDHANIAAPWLVRAAALMGRNQTFPPYKSLSWAQKMDIAPQFQGAVQPMPKPPVKDRPTRLNVTSVSILAQFPYQIYASRILGLSPLPGLAENMDYKDFGILIHTALEKIFKDKLPQNGSLQAIESVFLEKLAAAPYRNSLKDWWRPRLKEIAACVWEREQGNRAFDIYLEANLRYEFPHLNFTLTGRADRVDLISAEGEERAVIYDYKTNALPALKEVAAGLYPQLLLEGAVLKKGGFKDIGAYEIEDLIYWQLKGSSRKKDSVRPLLGKGKNSEILEKMDLILAELEALIEAYGQPEKAYDSSGAVLENPYAQLARLCEWRGM